MHTINLDDVKYTEIHLLAKTMQVKLLLYQLKIQTHLFIDEELLVWLQLCCFIQLHWYLLNMITVEECLHFRKCAAHQIQSHSTYLSKLSGDMPPDSPRKKACFSHTLCNYCMTPIIRISLLPSTPTMISPVSRVP